MVTSTPLVHAEAPQSSLTASPRAQVLDLGCGVGGPARCIAAFTGASVTGINNNDHQLQRAEALTAATWSRYHTGSCRFVKGDFMDLRALGLDAYDAANQIEATCHAPDIAAVYVQIFNALKPGGMFASYEWCMTSAFDTRNEEHVRLKHDILKGNGLPDLRTTSQVMDALKAAGFEVLDSQDVALTSQVPWYAPLDCSQPLLKAAFSRTGGGFRTSRLGRAVTRKAVYVLESMRIAPRGTCQVSAFLEQGADALVAGGKQGIFTPMWFTLVRKPLHTAAPARAPRGGGGQRGTGTLVIGTGDDVHIQPSRSVSLAGTAALGTQDVGKREVRSGQQQRSQASPGPSGAGLTPNRRSSRRAAE